MRMNPLAYFNSLFPSHRLRQGNDELRYIFSGIDLANIYEQVASTIIKTKTLPLTTDVEVWESKGVVREIAMVVRNVPDPIDFRYHDCSDEVPDTEGLDGGWYGATASDE
jgi:hypothetical protein